MDCEACTDRLIDLLYEEIEGADAEAARAHLAACETCAGAFERLSKGHELANRLTLQEPPAVLESVFAAARERAGRVSAKPEPVSQRVIYAPPREVAAADHQDDGLWSSLVRWLGSFAMGPQVAMATMLFLMVGIGLWYLPEWREADPLDTHAIVNPAAGDEAGPSAGILPAEPLALEEDPRRARIRPRTEDNAQERTTRGRSRGGSPAPAAPATTGAAAREQGAPPPSPAPAAAERPTTAETQAIANEQQALALDAPVEAEPAAPAQAFAEPPPEPAAPSVAPSAAPPAAPSAPMLAEGVARDAPGSDEMVPAGLHQMARNQAASNACPQAIRTYERLLAQFPTYPHASDARVELADCYRRTGRLTQARRSLEAASRDPRTASRAQRELVRLEAAERAMDRQRTETDRAPDAPAPTRATDDYEAPAPPPR